MTTALGLGLGILTGSFIWFCGTLYKDLCTIEQKFFDLETRIMELESQLKDKCESSSRF